MPFNIILPSSRGLSLALAQALLHSSPNHLIATCRHSPSALQSALTSSSIPSSRVTVLHADVKSEPTLAAAAAAVRTQFPTDTAEYIFSTAGVLYPERSPGAIEHDAALDTLRTNLLGPMLVMKHFGQFLPRRRRGDAEKGTPAATPAVWVNLSARVGSIGDNRAGGWYSYRASKAGLNAVTKSFDIYLAGRSGDAAMAVAIHPGTVRTGLSKEFWDHVPEGQLFEPEDAAEKVLGVVMGLDVAQRGGFYDWMGERVEW
ncbi:hypothetical protein BZA05DRAFT_406910 [Tricharina praecox]|uniref:uncharacterized protein n=1 Tax=Tricharina praecox TaxID=43433 RepID=UPI00221FC0AD|nr:uncharacterized protein BZA05DRAFT_406910 [Tricharina praecox]KAI5846082.1 hypothetical protein BZA05DRAFT_406910 [Tricharina praecox]